MRALTARAGQWRRKLLLATHFAHALSLAWTLALLELAFGYRLTLIGLALLPLALLLPGLIAGRNITLRWLSLALVLYSGLATVEVIATATVAASAWLLFALLEFALAFMLSRQPPRQSPDVTAES